MLTCNVTSRLARWSWSITSSRMTVFRGCRGLERPVGRLVGVRPQDQLQCRLYGGQWSRRLEGAIFDTATTGLPAGKAIGWRAGEEVSGVEFGGTDVREGRGLDLPWVQYYGLLSLKGHDIVCPLQGKVGLIQLCVDRSFLSGWSLKINRLYHSYLG